MGTFTLEIPISLSLMRSTARGNYLGSFASGTEFDPRSLAVDSSGAFYIGDNGASYPIIKLDSGGNLLLKFGTYANGQFLYPTGVATDGAGNLYVSDEGDNRIQKLDRNGNFLLKFGSAGSGNGQFNEPERMAVDSGGNVYVADSFNSRIQKFDSNGNYLMQFGNAGSDDGRLNHPEGVAVDSGGNIYVADTENFRIVKFDNNGAYLFAIGAGYNGSPGGVGTLGSGSGQFAYPSGIAVDKGGNIYVADNGNDRIQKFDAKGKFLLGVGSGYNGVPSGRGSANGQLNEPYRCIGG